MKQSPLLFLIEADLFLSRLYHAKFIDLGWQVKVIEPTSNICSQMADQPPAVVLLDIDMPQEDGWSILEKIKAEERFKDIPIVILTNRSSRSDVDKARQLGAAEFLIKAHFLPSEVVAAVRRQVATPS